MWVVYTIPCIALVLGFTLAAAGTVESGIGSRVPRDCGDVYLAGDKVEGFYVVFPNVANPDEAALVYCSIHDGMLPHNSSVPRTIPKNCKDLLDGGMTESGMYIIYPYAAHPEAPVIVYCEQHIMGGGWTVFQRRDNYDTQIDFYRSFDDYSLGFGQVGTEFWLGNDVIHELTQQSVSELYVELTSFANVTKYARYNYFFVGPKVPSDELDNRPYLLQVSHYSGDAGDGLTFHSGMGFTTYDSDHDLWSDGNDAQSYKGGWWYRYYHRSHLNGIYFEDGRDDSTSANWYYFNDGNYESLQKIQLMTRPLM